MRFKFFGILMTLSSSAIFAFNDPSLAVVKFAPNSSGLTKMQNSADSTFPCKEESVATTQNDLSMESFDHVNNLEDSIEAQNAVFDASALAGCSTSVCYTKNYDEPINKSSNELTERLQIGANYTYAKIRPKDNPSTKGSLGGAQILYEYRALKSVYAGVAFNWRDGTTKNSVGKRSLQDFNVQQRLGYSFAKMVDDSRWTLFSGFGCRYLAETVTVQGTSVDFDYTEFYVPVGFLFETRTNSFFSWGCNFQWLPQVLPMVNIAPLNGTRWKLSYQLTNLLAELPLIFSWSDRFALMFIPFVESWNDGHSTAKTSTGLTLGLPSNKYFFAGVNVNLAYKF